MSWGSSIMTTDWRRDNRGLISDVIDPAKIRDQGPNGKRQLQSQSLIEYHSGPKRRDQWREQRAEASEWGEWRKWWRWGRLISFLSDISITCTYSTEHQQLISHSLELAWRSLVWVHKGTWFVSDDDSVLGTIFMGSRIADQIDIG